MSNKIVQVDALSDAIKEEIDKMNQTVIDGCNQAAKTAAQDAAKELKSTSPARTDGYNRKHPPGSYAKSWAIKKTSSTRGVEEWTVYNQKHYQLTHLLEFGHVIAQTGGRSTAISHIAPANDNAAKELEKLAEEIKL